MHHLLILASAIALLALPFATGLPPATGEETKLPPKAQDVMNKLEKSESKLTADYKKALNAERGRAITDLQKAQKDVTKTGDLEGALAIKKQIEALHANIAEDEETDLLGNPKGKPDPTKLLLGKWDFVKNNGMTGVLDFKADGNCIATITAPVSLPYVPGKWQFKDEKIHVTWFGDANKVDTLVFTAATKLAGDTHDLGKKTLNANKLPAEK